jgi:hypothetical protein
MSDSFVSYINLITLLSFLKILQLAVNSEILNLASKALTHLPLQAPLSTLFLLCVLSLHALSPTFHNLNLQSCPAWNRLPPLFAQLAPVHPSPLSLDTLPRKPEHSGFSFPTLSITIHRVHWPFPIRLHLPWRQGPTNIPTPNIATKDIANAP